MAAWMRPGKEKDQASEGEEEEEEGEGGEERGGSRWEYDSTWEEEEEEEEKKGRREKKEWEPASQAANLDEATAREKHSWRPPSPKWASASQEWRRPGLSTGGVKKWKSINRRNWDAARDLQKYRRHYPGLEETDLSEEDMWNLSFYKNEINFLPRGLYIEDLLELWQDNYGVLEENHSYIQWLFPLREQGMNFYAKRLTRQEIEAFKKSKEVMERFVRAYKLMLRFYGVNLINEETGELRKAENWRERFGNLNWYSHNNLRITRILKCLGEMGYEHYQVQLVKFFLIETLVHQELPRVLRSALDYFMFTIRNKPKRRELVYFAWQHFKPKHEFVWGPHKKLRRFKPQSPKFLSNPEEQAHTKKGDGEVVVKDNIESPQKILQRPMEKPEQEGAGEGAGEVEKDNIESPQKILQRPMEKPGQEGAGEVEKDNIESPQKILQRPMEKPEQEGSGEGAGDVVEKDNIESPQKILQRLTEKPGQDGAGEGAGEVVEKDNIESPQKILQRPMEKPGQEGAGESLEKENSGLPEEKCVTEHDLDTTINHNHIEQPVSNSSAKLSLSASNSVQDKGSRRRVTSVEGDDLLQDGELVEPQMKPVGDCKTSRKANQPHFASVTVAKAEKEDNEEGTVSSDCPSERRYHADESVGGAEGGGLKESKKRKLEMSRLSGESPGVPKSPSDIERISQNLGEVVITKEEIGSLAPEGGNEDSRDGKEAEPLDAVIKRRKVDVAPKGDSSEVDSEAIPSKGQGTSCITHDVKKTDPVCQGEPKAAVSASVDTLTGPRAGGVDVLVDSKKNDLPVDDCPLEKVKEQEATTPTESEAAWLSETLVAHERGVRNSAGWEEQDTEETSGGSTGRNKIPKINEHENTMAGPEKE